MRALTCIAALLAVASLPWGAEARGRAPSVEEVEQSVMHDRSYRLRVGAALVLGRLGQPRSVPALTSALGDGNPAVRATAAQALGRIGDPAARAALERAMRDGDPLVRRMAGQALRAVAQPPASSRRGDRDDEAPSAPDRPRPAFDVKAMGDRSHRASPALRGHMRELVADRLRPVGDVSPAGVDPLPGFVVDGSIKALTLNARPTMVEVACAVQLVISRQPSGGVFMLTSGEAIVQKPRRQFRPQHRAGMEREALESAVRGASDDLVRRLAQP